MVYFIIVIVLVVMLAAKEAKTQGAPPEQSAAPPEYPPMRCPSCGEPVRVCGTSWECTWCSDFGNISR